MKTCSSYGLFAHTLMMILTFCRICFCQTLLLLLQGC
jgi:hypothetical protein